MSGGRGKLFVENFLVYGLSGIIGKVIPLFMLPIVTRLVPDSSVYGTADLLNVIVSFGTAFAVLGLYDAMFRTFFDDEASAHRSAVCSTAAIIVAASSLTLGLLLVVFSGTLSKALFSSVEYHFWVCLMGIQTFLSSVHSILSAPTRMQNRRKVYVLLSIIMPVFSYGVSIPLIVFIDPLLGLVMGGFFSSLLSLAIFWSLNKGWFKPELFDRKLGLEMLKIGLPLMPTFLIYWVYSSMDRIMISHFLGTTENGIYAVGAKISQISQFFYTAFAGGWQYFAFSTMKDQDQVDLNSRVFEYLGVLSFFGTIGLIPFIPSIFQLLFKGRYIEGYTVAPYLFLSPLLLMLFQVAGNQLLVIKKSFWVTLSLLLGAMVNLILNYGLIPVFGIRGAAVATLMGYTCSVAAIAALTVKWRLLGLKKRFFAVAFLVFGSLVLASFPKSQGISIVSILYTMASLAWTLFLYRYEAHSVFLHFFPKRKLA